MTKISCRFIYLGFYVAFNTVQVISRWVVGRAEETSTYSSLGLCSVNCRPTAKQLPAFPLKAVTGIEPRPQRWEARVLPLCHRGPRFHVDCLFVYLGFYVAFNTVQVISRRVVGRAEETSTYSSLGFCTVNCRPTASNYQLSHLQP